MMSNYTLFPVQTHLELFLQMKEKGAYSAEDIELCNKAYYLSLTCVFSMVRGSGKPFICHLLGTASILVDQGAPIQVVVAGLMHAIYQRRVKFPGAGSFEQRRMTVASEFGQEIARLIEEYTRFEDVPLMDLEKIRDRTTHFQEVLLMRLSDELEDLSYYALFMHGNPADTVETKGGYLWRRESKRRQVEALLEMSGLPKTSKLVGAFLFWINTEPDSLWTSLLRSGMYSSFELGS